MHQKTTPYTPQQNGVSERKNRAVMNICLIFEKKLPKTFWAEAVNTSVYLLNRLPTKGLSSRQVDLRGNGAVDRIGSSRQVENCTGKAVDRLRMSSRRAETSRQVEISSEKPVERFSAESSSSR